MIQSLYNFMELNDKDLPKLLEEKAFEKLLINSLKFCTELTNENYLFSIFKESC